MFYPQINFYSIPNAIRSGSDRLGMILTTYLQAPATANYVFELYLDDSAQVSFNGTTVFNNYGDSGRRTYVFGPVALIGGTYTPLRILWNNNGGGNANLVLRWKNALDLGDYAVIPIDAFSMPQSQVQLGIPTAFSTAELAAFRGLYNDAGGASWNTKQFWSSFVSYNVASPGASTPHWDHFICCLARVYCDLGNSTKPIVRSLWMPQNGMSGTLPTNFGDLPDTITSLNFATEDRNRDHINRLAGTFPEMNNKMPNLAYVDIRGNRFTSLSGFRGLPALSTLFLDDNAQLTSLGSDFGTNNQLAKLYMRRLPALTSLPASFGTGLSQVNEIQANDGGLTSLPSDMSGLVKVVTFNLNNNKLTSLPDLSGMVELVTLSCQGNRISSLPSTWNTLTKLNKIELDANSLTSIPNGLSLTPNLKILQLPNNMITALPSNFGSLSQLQQLHLEFNRLENLPASISTLIQLETFHLQNNSLASLPASIGTLPALKWLYVSNNPLLTTLPVSIQSLPELQQVTFDGCGLTTLPDGSWESLAKLKVLNLERNRLSSLPADLGDAPVLETLNVAFNLITELPSSLNRSVALVSFTANNNRLGLWAQSAVGAPVFMHLFRQLNQLQTLDLSYNDLSSVPADLWGLPMVETIQLSHNQLLQSVPAVSLGNLGELRTLDLSHNQLYGPWPDALSTLPKIATLDLSHNAITNSRQPNSSVPWSASETYFQQFQPFASTAGSSMPSSLSSVDVTNNLLVGYMPSSFGSLGYTLKWNGNAIWCNDVVCNDCIGTCNTFRVLDVVPKEVPNLLTTTLTIRGVNFDAGLRCAFDRSGVGVNTALVDANTVTCESPMRSQTGPATVRLLRFGSALVHSQQLTFNYIFGCPPGWRTSQNPSDGSLTCAECTSGYFTTSANNTRCEACAPGKFAPTTRATTCQLCGLSQFNEFSAKADCVPCPAGRFGNSTGASSCHRCGVGSFAAVVQQSVCSDCVPGTFSDQFGSETCSPCERDSFSANFSAVSCNSCPAQSLTTLPGAKSISDCRCVAGYYGFPGSSCKACPEGGECPGGTNYPLVGPGYWGDASQNPETFFKCTPPESCVGLGRCAEGYTGRLCGDCVALKYYKLGERCFKCPDSSAQAALMWVVMFALGMGLSAAVIAAGRQTTMRVHSPGIGLSFVQLLSLYHRFDVDWPNTLQGMFDSASFANLNVELFSPECAVELSYWDKWHMKLALPFFFLGFFVVWYLLWRLFECCRARRRDMGNMTYMERRNATRGGIRDRAGWGHAESMENRFIYGFVTILYLAYTFMASTASEPFNCSLQPDGSYSLWAAAHITCYDGEWNSKIWASIVAILVYSIGLPVAFAYILWRAHRNVQLESPGFLARFGVLTYPYRRKRFFWELVHMVRKASSIFIIDLLNGPDLRFLQINLGCLIIFGFIVLQVFTQPYELNWNNRLAFMWLQLSFYFLFAALIFRRGDGGTAAVSAKKGDIDFFAWLLVTLFLISLVLSIIVVSVELRRAWQRRDLEKRQSVVGVQHDHKQEQILLRLYPRSGPHLWGKIRKMKPKMRELFMSESASLLESSGTVLFKGGVSGAGGAGGGGGGRTGGGGGHFAGPGVDMMGRADSFPTGQPAPPPWDQDAHASSASGAVRGSVDFVQLGRQPGELAGWQAAQDRTGESIEMNPLQSGTYQPRQESLGL